MRATTVIVLLAVCVASTFAFIPVKLPKSPPTPCCLASQYELYQFTWDPTKRFDGGWFIASDATNSRVFMAGTDYKGKKQHAYNFQTLYLYDSKKMYYIDSTGACFEGDLNSTMGQQCVPSFASYEGSPTVGGSLVTNVFNFEVGTGKDTDYNTAVVTATGCIPVSDILASEKLGVLDTTYWDYVGSITNTSVFNIPKGCPSVQKLFEKVPKPHGWRWAHLHEEN